MPEFEKPQSVVRFEGFELDLRAGELRANAGSCIRLSEQPFRILTTLLEQPGEVVLREEIRKKLWPNNTVVEFEHSINAAMKRLRQALGDSAENPHYIETLARRGYRWMVPVEWGATPARLGLPAVAPPERSSAANLVGKKVSHYRVLEVLGGGGMGVVYKAEDLKLGRRVALKFLPEEVASEPSALERFEREARAASALDHPNICAIYEFGEHEGQPFIVMQLLEGHTLRERIGAEPPQPGKPLPADELLDFAGQVTRGLEAAHQKGIIHRDIKPANIFITNRGEAKILDFGVAKLVHGDRSLGATAIPERHNHALPPDAASSSLNLTRTGTTVGTASYMSPEQILGETLDTRTDLFSFGLVLHEMATGHQAFTGDTAEVVREAILHRPAQPARQLNAQLPAKFEGIIAKALEKNRELRYQSASEMSADLKSLAGDTDSGRPRARSRLATAASALSPLVLTALLVWFFASSVPAPSVRQIGQLTHFGRVDPNHRLVTDGARLYFVERRGGHYSLAQVSADGGEPTPIITPFRNTTLYDISPDHSELLVGSFTSLGEEESALWILPTAGGSPRRLGEVMGHSAAWSPDGQRIVYSSGSDLFLVKPDGADSRRLLNAVGRTSNPRWSSDGLVLRFTVWGPGTPTDSLWEVSADGRNLHRLLAGWREPPTAWGDGEAGGDWTADGKYFIFHSVRAGHASVWARHEKRDALRRRPRDPLLLNTSDLHLSNVLPGQNGRKVFFAGGKESRELARYDSRLKQLVPYLSGVPARYVSFSGDGQWVAYVTVPGFLLWRSRVDGSERLQLTFSPMGVGDPQWSPDGKQIAFSASSPPGIFLVSSAGGTPEVVIAGDAYGMVRPNWSPQGDSLLFTRSSPAPSGQGEQVGIYQVDLKTKKQSLFPGSEGFRDSERSPDGRYVAALADDAKKVVLFDSESQRWKEIAKGIGLFGLAWSADSKYVYSQDVSAGSEQPIFRVRISDRKMDRVATSSQILRADVTNFSFLGLSPDDSPLVTLMHSNSDIYALDVDFP